MAHVDGQVGYSEEFFVNSRGMQLLTCKWFPVNQEPRALIFFCHGYAIDCSTTFKDIATKFAKEGFSVYGIEYEGHGRSEGLSVYIDNFDLLIDDVSSHFSNIAEMGANTKRKKFLMGESMGGAVVLLLHRKKPEFWDGGILIAPMCKIRDNPNCYDGRPRIKTMSELYRVSIDLENRLHEVTMPFIVLHGEDDKVTDKEASKLLYEVTSSNDKTLKLYPEMWHSLLFGEPLENSEIVFNDIVQWMETRITTLQVKAHNNEAKPQI
ncbi:hypothetical protein AALP_AA5G191300 [Arabis alpina]|uniref:Serine aminopeptidase S33 domain-containing protein n=1 Tax=Arabis alpina TaxID=50452 RepID=A0A087GY16_ARAAL|nr:hypothetical protein AALP_AA5G191300 [Arabis alpina]